MRGHRLEHLLRRSASGGLTRETFCGRTGTRLTTPCVAKDFRGVLLTLSPCIFPVKRLNSPAGLTQPRTRPTPRRPQRIRARDADSAFACVNKFFARRIFRLEGSTVVCQGRSRPGRTPKGYRLGATTSNDFYKHFVAAPQAARGPCGPRTHSWIFRTDVRRFRRCDRARSRFPRHTGPRPRRGWGG